MVRPIHNVPIVAQQPPTHSISTPKPNELSRGGLAHVPTRMLCFAPPPKIVLKGLEAVGFFSLMGFFTFIGCAIAKYFATIFSRCPSQPLPPSQLAPSTIPDPVSPILSPVPSNTTDDELEDDSSQVSASVITSPRSAPEVGELRIEFIEFNSRSPVDLARGARIKAMALFLPVETVDEYVDPINAEIMGTPLFHFGEQDRHRQFVTRNGERLFVETRHPYDASSLISGGLSISTCPECSCPISAAHLALNITLQKEIERAVVQAFAHEVVTAEAMIVYLRELMLTEVGKIRDLTEALKYIPNKKMIKNGTEIDLRTWLTQCYTEAMHRIPYDFVEPLSCQSMSDRVIRTYLQRNIEHLQAQGYSLEQAKAKVIGAIMRIPSDIPATNSWLPFFKDTRNLRQRMLDIWVTNFS